MKLARFSHCGRKRGMRRIVWWSLYNLVTAKCYHREITISSERNKNIRGNGDHRRCQNQIFPHTARNYEMATNSRPSVILREI